MIRFKKALEAFQTHREIQSDWTRYLRSSSASAENERTVRMLERASVALAMLSPSALKISRFSFDDHSAYTDHPNIRFTIRL